MSLGAREEDRDRLVGSLETIIQTLLGRELDTLRQSVSDLGSDLARRIDASSEETTGNLEALRTEMLSEGEGAKREALSAMETLRNDVFSEIESARQEAIGSLASLKETLTASIEENRTRASTLEETVTRTLADLAARATEIDERADTRLETTKRDLEQKLEDAASRLQEEGHSLLARLDAVEHELREHTTASGRVVEVFDSLGEVLSRKTGEIVDPPQQPAAEMSPGQDEPSESADTVEVEDALERVFPLMPTQTSPRIPE
jgi:predicted ribosome quality control (RQC) complex YloA/Tae2 family protein